jgi:hypothetical protein
MVWATAVLLTSSLTYKLAPLHSVHSQHWTWSVEWCSLGADSIVNTASNISFAAASLSCHTDRVEYTASKWVHSWVLEICCLVTDVVYGVIT